MTVQIESPQNPRLKALRRLQTRRERVRSGRFLAEGEDLIAAARIAGTPALEGYRLAGSGLGGEDFFDVERSALAAAAQTTQFLQSWVVGRCDGHGIKKAPAS